MTKQEARNAIKECQAILIEKKAVAVFKKPYDNGSEATLPAVLVGSTLKIYEAQKARMGKIVLKKFKEAKFSYTNLEYRKGRCEQFFCIYFPYHWVPPVKDISCLMKTA